MLVFIDESGDTGLKVANGSSEFFVVALVTFEDHDEATACDQRIELLKRELGLGPTDEFKFGKLSGKKREAFFEAIHRSLTEKQDHAIYRQKMSAKEMSVQVWPK